MFQCRADAAESIGTLCQMISRQRINKDLKKLVTMFLAVSKKTVTLHETFSITKVIFLKRKQIFFLILKLIVILLNFIIFTE